MVVWCSVYQFEQASLTEVLSCFSSLSLDLIVSAEKQYVQADLDSPYPRTKSGGVASAWTRYGEGNEMSGGIDGRLGSSHRRLKAGQV